jgi:preprotein translocase subunit SecF
MSRLSTLSTRLYNGQISYDFVGRRKIWYAISALLVAISIGFLVGPGLKLGIEFTGGTVFQLQSEDATIEEAREVVEGAGASDVLVTETSSDRLRIQTEELEREERAEIVDALSEAFDVPVDEIDVQFVGPSWGEQITQKAIQGLLIFIVLAIIFLSVYFEWKMAVAAMVALVHDVVLTVGIYAILGIEVTPATVIGVLTILGYSLYDTVVVFDKVRENTAGLAGGSRMTYSEAANLSVNQVLVRSINTSIVALLPILAILIGGVGFLGADTLTEFALALFVGMAAGTYSSIFIATPLLADLKEREPQMQALARRVEQRRGGLSKKASGGSEIDPDAVAAAARGSVAAGPRNQPKSKKRASGKKR